MHLVNSVKWEMRGHHPGVPTQTHAHDPEAQRETALEIYFWKNQIQKWIHKIKPKPGSLYCLNISLKSKASDNLNEEKS